METDSRCSSCTRSADAACMHYAYYAVWYAATSICIPCRPPSQSALDCSSSNLNIPSSSILLLHFLPLLLLLLLFLLLLFIHLDTGSCSLALTEARAMYFGHSLTLSEACQHPPPSPRPNPRIFPGELFGAFRACNAGPPAS